MQGEYLKLNRMWLDNIVPQNSESRAISYAIKFIRQAYPGMAWTQRYSARGVGILAGFAQTMAEKSAKDTANRSTKSRMRLQVLSGGFLKNKPTTKPTKEKGFKSILP